MLQEVGTRIPADMNMQDPQEGASDYLQMRYRLGEMQDLGEGHVVAQSPNLPPQHIASLLVGTVCSIHKAE